MTEVSLGRALTGRALAVTLFFLIIVTVLSMFTWLHTSRDAVVMVLMLPFFYVALLNAIFGRISSKLRLSPSEMTLLYLVVLFMIGVGPAAIADNHPQYIELTITCVGAALVEPELQSYFKNWVPSFMFPKSDTALSIFYSGLQPGQSIPWNEFALPIAYWSAYVILIYLFILWFIFGIAGRRWVEVERCLFPMAQPVLYVIQASNDIDKETGKDKWLSLKVTDYKIFWIAFAVGLLLSSFPIAAQFLPIFLPPGAQEYGATPIEFPQLAAILPGTMARGTFQIDQITLWLLLPINSLVTFVVMWIIFGLIYPAVAVQLGIIPYEPGMEFRWSWDDTPGNWYPLPFEVMWIGVLLGFGVVTLWSLRDRFRDMINALMGKDKIEYGLSLRFISIIGVIAIVGLAILFIGTGVPVPIVIIMMVLLIVISTYLGKLQGLFWFHVGDFIQWGGTSLIWVPGGLMGYWPLTPTIEGKTYAAFATATMQIPTMSSWTYRCVGISPGGMGGLYKVAYETKTNLRDLVIGSLIVFIIGVPLSYVVYMWILLHSGGITNTSSWGSWVHWWKYGYGLYDNWTAITGDSRFEAPLQWYAIGFVLFLIVYALRRTFTWFFIDPAAFAFALPYIDYIWLCALVALIVKVILVRVLGATRFERYALALASGVAWGYGAPLLVAWAIEFTTVCIPRFMSLYVP